MTGDRTLRPAGQSRRRRQEGGGRRILHLGLYKHYQSSSSRGKYRVGEIMNKNISKHHYNVGLVFTMCSSWLADRLVKGTAGARQLLSPLPCQSKYSLGSHLACLHFESITTHVDITIPGALLCSPRCKLTSI